jgi:distribution and morphology protein 34
MSFGVNWPQFDKEFIQKAKEQLDVALNNGKKIENIVGSIKCTELVMGSVPPELEILEISELTPERFKGIFKLAYNGNGLSI